jgi:hypothetical protein
MQLTYPEVRGHILAVLQHYGIKIKKDFDATAATWKDHHPVFTPTRKFAGGVILFSVTTKDQVWGILNRGTDFRWAVMSHDFSPKTVPRQLTSYPGSGKVLYRGPAEMKAAGIGWAQPGIEPREWTKTVMDLYRPSIRRDLRAAVRKGIRGAQQKGRF